EVANADGSKAFLALLREAYLAELFRLEKADTPDAAAVAKVRRNLSLIGGTTPTAAKPAEPPARSEVPAIPEPSFDRSTTEITPETAAAAAFKKGDYAVAAKLFAASPSLTADQKAAWAYCRVRLAADRLNAP